MSLINYVEPISAGEIFIGIGSLIIAIVISWIIYKVFRPICFWIEGLYNKDLRYWIVEEKMLNDIAKEKGIDIEAELIKRSILLKKTKSFRNKIEEEVYNKMFPKDADNKE